MRNRRLIVLKFGGSVLRDCESVRVAAEEVARFVEDGYRVVAVVSALNGETDRLVKLAGATSVGGGDFARALLVSTGELVSTALLGLALREREIEAEVLDSASAGIRTEGSPLDAAPVSLNIAAIERAFGRSPVVVIPGFVGRDEENRVTVLGRGGSDFTALFVAHQLDARCRLIKDVDGLYDRDPNLCTNGSIARRYATLHWEDALRLDGKIVQHKAVRWAGARELEFEIGAIGRSDCTRVGDCVPTFEQGDAEVKSIGRLASRITCDVRATIDA